MGGGDKPLRTIAGRSILAHVVERLSPQCDSLVVNANGDPARFADYGLPVVADSVPDFAGPLAGILAGLDWMAANRPANEWLVSVAADTPFIPRDLVARLHEARAAQNVPLACAASGGWTHPVIGLWPVSLRDDLRRALTVEDERKIDRWTARHGCASAEWPVEPVDPFFNANRPEDLDEAERLFATLPPA
jgi:molybdopterin-guanine dinucleotide biosynthesis protein A